MPSLRRSILSPGAKSVMTSWRSSVPMSATLLNTNRSLPAPPCSVSAPAPPVIVSLPRPPLMISPPERRRLSSPQPAVRRHLRQRHSQLPIVRPLSNCSAAAQCFPAPGTSADTAARQSRSDLQAYGPVIATGQWNSRFRLLSEPRTIPVRQHAVPGRAGFARAGVLRDEESLSPARSEAECWVEPSRRPKPALAAGTSKWRAVQVLPSTLCFLHLAGASRIFMCCNT